MSYTCSPHFCLNIATAPDAWFFSFTCFHYLNVNCPSRCIIFLILLMQNSTKYYASRWASIKIHIIFDKYLIRARMKSLGGQICFTIIPDSLIDSIVETINHIHCENTLQRIFEQFFFFVTLWAIPSRWQFLLSKDIFSH